MKKSLVLAILAVFLAANSALAWDRHGHGYHHPRRQTRVIVVERHHRHGGNEMLGNVVGGLIGGLVAGAIVNNARQASAPQQPLPPPRPVNQPPVQQYAYDDSCRSGAYVVVNGGSDDAKVATRRALYDRNYRVVEGLDGADCELRIVYEKSLGDPIYQVVLEMYNLRTGRMTSSSDGSSYYKARNEWARREAVVAATRTAVGNL